ncbi:hypothetical protein AKJ16_DCAP05926, partial [Drosera capensis]
REEISFYFSCSTISNANSIICDEQVNSLSKPKWEVCCFRHLRVRSPVRDQKIRLIFRPKKERDPNRKWEKMWSMWFDILLQAVMILGSIFMFLWMHDIPKKLFTELHRRRNSSKYEAKRRFVVAAQLLSRARSASDRTLASSAVEEADRAIALDPSDAASHILKAMALHFQGFNASAIDSLDAALSPLAVKSLSDEEKADALFKRAELRIETSRLGNKGKKKNKGEEMVVDDHDEALAAAGVEEDLVEVVKLRPGNAKAWCRLGECRKAKGMTDAAKEAFEAALKADPESKAARDDLDRLISS